LKNLKSQNAKHNREENMRAVTVFFSNEDILNKFYEFFKNYYDEDKIIKLTEKDNAREKTTII